MRVSIGSNGLNQNSGTKDQNVSGQQQHSDAFDAEDASISILAVLFGLGVF